MLTLCKPSTLSCIIIPQNIFQNIRWENATVEWINVVALDMMKPNKLDSVGLNLSQLKKGSFSSSSDTQLCI